jgi:AraC-like DNA-binding protein/ligand-binding sensor protein
MEKSIIIVYYSIIIEVLMRKSEEKQLLLGIKAYEQTFKCHVTIYDYSGQLKQEIHRLPFFHLNPFCTAFKDKRSTLTATCITFDHNTVQQRLAEQPAAFLKYCHCGLLEVVIPLFIAGKISGAMFVGPFRWHNDQLPPDVLYSKAKTLKDSLIKSSLTPLPVIDDKIVEQIIAIGKLICTNIDKIISHAKQVVVRATGSRREKITGFLDEQFTKNISLADLAHALLLSESRTSQLVKKLFKMNFPELLTRHRLEYARSLLEHSMFNLEHVAEYSGFKDVAYFYRVFRKYHNLAPGQYRKNITSSNS